MRTPTSSPPVTVVAALMLVSTIPFGPAERTHTGMVAAAVKSAALITYGLPQGSTGSWAEYGPAHLLSPVAGWVCPWLTRWVSSWFQVAPGAAQPVAVPKKARAGVPAAGPVKS